VLDGRSAVHLIDRFDPGGFRSQVAGQVDDFDPLDHFEAARARRLDRYSQLALAAAQQAVTDSGLCLSRADAEHTGVYMGSALGGLSFAEEQHSNYVQSGLRSVNTILALTVFGAASSCNIAMEMGLYGPNTTNSNSCASGTVAIGEAARLIRSGGARVVLAGGVEAPLAPLTFGAFDVIRALSSNFNAEPERACRPFDARRDGFVMAEGAAVLVLEEWEHAVARGATIYAEILGYSTTTDAYHMTAPRPDGAQAIRAMREALSDAHLEPHEVGYINAHASSTPLNDKTETLAIKQVFGEDAYSVPISGTKAMHGHALGATGAFEVAISCLTLQHHYLPPTINLHNPDPECDLDYIPNVGRHEQVDTILSNSFGFGGINASIVLARA
jgi:3-oxoacyl-[acyl-carrier-protein] synthase II